MHSSVSMLAKSQLIIIYTYRASCKALRPLEVVRSSRPSSFVPAILPPSPLRLQSDALFSRVFPVFPVFQVSPVCAVYPVRSVSPVCVVTPVSPVSSVRPIP